MTGPSDVKLSEAAISNRLELERWTVKTIPGSDMFRVVRLAVGGECCVAAWVELEIAQLLAAALNAMDRRAKKDTTP